MVGGGWRKPGVQDIENEQKNGGALLFKLIIVGEAGVGKSSLIARYTMNAFNESYVSTIGVDFAMKSMISPDGDIVKLQIWDTAGQERFRNITHSYYRGSHGVMIVFDMTSKESYKKAVSDWIAETQSHTEGNVPIILIGSKGDDQVNRQVTEEDFRKVAEYTGFPVMEVSAKEDIGVTQAFEKILDIMWKKNQAAEASNADDSSMRNEEKKPTKSDQEKNIVLGKEHCRCGKGKCF